MFVASVFPAPLVPLGPIDLVVSVIDSVFVRETTDRSATSRRSGILLAAGIAHPVGSRPVKSVRVS